MFDQNVIFYGIIPYSMTSNICKDFYGFSRPGNQSFKYFNFWRYLISQIFISNITSKIEWFTVLCPYTIVFANLLQFIKQRNVKFIDYSQT